MGHNYKKLINLAQEVEILSDIRRLLEWDTEVNLPPKAGMIRARQSATIAALISQKSTNQEIPSILEAAKDEKLNEYEKRNIYLIDKQYNLLKAVPEKLITELETKKEACLTKWGEAKVANNFNVVKDSLDQLFKLIKEKYELQAGYLGCLPYEAALDEYDEGRTITDIDRKFGKLKEFLPSFKNKIINNQAKLVESKAYNIPKFQQKEFCIFLMKKMGFDFNCGRLDESAHPFVTGSSKDIRVSSYYHEGDIMKGLTAIIHETGHALYEQSLPEEYQLTPVGRANGMAIHESQSLFMQFIVGGNKTFIRDLYNEIKHSFPEFPYTQEEFYKLRNIVMDSPIRVFADEVTYPLHIVLRYEIEKALFDGSLEIKDLKEAWDSKFNELFGFRPKDDINGCIQDIHWHWGIFGYFPAYAIGLMTATQIDHIINAQGINYESFSSFSDFNKVLKGLVHTKGSLLGKGLFENLTVEANSKSMEECYISYLQNKYSIT
jgi:carboxypeptidase Taq